MATIFQAPPQVPQQIAQQAPQQVQQASQPNTQDPLFQALARYITSGPGPSSTTVEAVQSIIDSHASQENGLEYLQSVVSPPQPTLRIWPRYGSAQGTIKTTLDALHLDFRVMAKNRDGQVGTSLGFEFKGEASGIFMPQLISFESEFFWENIPWNDLVRFKLTYHRFLGIITVEFRGIEVAVIPAPPPFAELGLKASGMFPNEVNGTGKFTKLFE